MIKIDKLHITITASDCPNLSYQFDFSEFYNKNLARKCIDLFKQKYEQGVSLTYLRVLSTAYVHYDRYLRINNHSSKLLYSPKEKTKYLDHLNTVLSINNKPYSKQYIDFLAYAPNKLENREEQTNESE